MSKVRFGLWPLLSKDGLDRFQHSGIYSVSAVTEEDAEEVSKTTGVAFKDIVSLRRILLAEYSAFPISGADLYNDVATTVAILSTGCASLDALLEGGIYTTELTEVVGTPGAGKTQVCLSTAVTTVTQTKQGVIWVDTGASLDTHRLHDLLEAKSITRQESKVACSKIQRHMAFDVSQLLAVLENIRKSLSQQAATDEDPVKLLVVDCVTAVISPVLGGQQTDGHGLMMQVSQSLKSLALDFALSVMVTNNIVSGDIQRYASQKPALGLSWSHVPNTRLHIQKHDTLDTSRDTPGGTDPNVRTAVLVKSCRQVTCASTKFCITDSNLKS